MRNPAAVYCTDIMGYEYQVVDGVDDEQQGICMLPDSQKCEEWAFYSGACGQSYSYCAKQGYHTETRNDGGDPFSMSYAVCVSSDGQVAGSVTQLSDLSSNAISCDAEKCQTTAIQDADRQQEDSVPHHSTTGVSVPSSFDWRNYQGQNWLTSVKNQGGCGSCWAFAAAGVTEAHHNIFFSNPDLDLNLAEQELVSCSGVGNCNGAWATQALRYISSNGLVDESCIPYTASNSSCNRCSNWQDRLTYEDEVYSFTPIPPVLKENMVTYGPLYVAMGIGEDFGGYFESNGIYRCSKDSQSGASGSNHAVMLVGYNDAGGYWIVRNSWGNTWNGNGYFKVGYGECNSENTDAAYVYVVPPVTTPSLVGVQENDGWYSSNVTATLTVNEAVAWTKYRVGDVSWQIYNTPFAVTCDGIHSLEHYSKDSFGAEESIQSIPVKINRTALTPPPANAYIEGWTQWSTRTPQGSFSLSNCEPLHIGDINGDGRDDLVCPYNYGSSSTATWIQLASSSGFSDWAQWSTRTPQGSFSLSNCEPLHIGDINGDGRDDLVCPYDYGSSSTATWIQLASSSGFSDWTQWSTRTPQGSFSLSNCEPLHIGDINGDGRDDLICPYDYGSSSTATWIQLASSSGFSDWTQWSTRTPQGSFSLSNCEPLHIGDINGDGRDDLVCPYHYGPCSTTTWVQLASGSAFSDWTAWGPASPGLNIKNCRSMHIGDINGDKRADLICLYDYGSDTTTTLGQLSSGNAFGNWIAWSPRNNGGFTLSRCKPSFIGDIEGDGHSDVVCPYDYGNASTATWAQATSWTAIYLPLVLK